MSASVKRHFEIRTRTIHIVEKQYKLGAKYALFNMRYVKTI